MGLDGIDQCAEVFDLGVGDGGAADDGVGEGAQLIGIGADVGEGAEVLGFLFLVGGHVLLTTGAG